MIRQSILMLAVALLCFATVHASSSSSSSSSASVSDASTVSIASILSTSSLSSVSSFSAELSTISHGDSVSDYDFDEQIEAKPYEDLFIHVSNPVVDLLDDDDSDFIPTVTTLKELSLFPKYAPFVPLGSGTSSSSSSVFSTGSLSTASSSDFSSSSSDDDDDKKKRNVESSSAGDCDFAALECQACQACAEDYDSARCLCVKGLHEEDIDLSSATGPVCVAVARDARLQAELTTSSHNDCVVNGGRIGDFDVTLGAGDDVFVGVAGSFHDSHVYGEAGDDRYVLRSGASAYGFYGNEGDDRIMIEEQATGYYVYGGDESTNVIGDDIYVIAGSAYELMYCADAKCNVAIFLTDTATVVLINAANSDNGPSLMKFVGSSHSRIQDDAYVNGDDIDVHFGGLVGDDLDVGGVDESSKSRVVLYSEASLVYELYLYHGSFDVIIHNRVALGSIYFESEDSGALVENQNIEIHDNVAVGDYFDVYDDIAGSFTLTTGKSFFTGYEFHVEDIMGDIFIRFGDGFYNSYDVIIKADYDRPMYVEFGGSTSIYSFLFGNSAGATSVLRMHGYASIYSLELFGNVDAYLSGVTVPDIDCQDADSDDSIGTINIALGGRSVVGDDVKSESAEEVNLYVEAGSFVWQADTLDHCEFEDVLGVRALCNCVTGCPEVFAGDKNSKRKRSADDGDAASARAERNAIKLEKKLKKREAKAAQSDSSSSSSSSSASSVSVSDASSVSISTIISASSSASSFSPELSSISSSSYSPSDYDFGEQIEATPFEDLYIFVSNPSVDLLDDDDSDFIPEVTTKKAKPGLLPTYMSLDELPTSSSFSTTLPSEQSSSDFAPSSSDEDRKRDVQGGDCDFAASQCQACQACAENYDAARCICIRGTNDTDLDYRESTEPMCVVVAHESRYEADLTLSPNNDCLVNAGRMTGDFSVNMGYGDDVFVAMAGSNNDGEVNGDEGNDRVVVRSGATVSYVYLGEDDDRFLVEELGYVEYVYADDGNDEPGKDIIVCAGYCYGIYWNGVDDGETLMYLTDTAAAYEVGESDAAEARVLKFIGSTYSRIAYAFELYAHDNEVHFGGQCAGEYFYVYGDEQRSKSRTVLYSDARTAYYTFFVYGAHDIMLHNGVQVGYEFFVESLSGSSTELVENYNIEIHDYFRCGYQMYSHEDMAGKLTLTIGLYAFIRYELNMDAFLGGYEVRMAGGITTQYVYFYDGRLSGNSIVEVGGRANVYGWYVGYNNEEEAHFTFRLHGFSNAYEFYAYDTVDAYLSNAAVGEVYCREGAETTTCNLALGNRSIVTDDAINEVSDGVATLFVQESALGQYVGDFHVCKFEDISGAAFNCECIDGCPAVILRDAALNP